MIVYPTAPLPGERVSATLIREMIRVMRAITPIQGPGITLRQGPNGTAISATSQTMAPAAAVFEHPWKVTASPDGFCVYLPAKLVFAENEELEIEGVTESEDRKFRIECESELPDAEDTFLWITVYKDSEGVKHAKVVCDLDDEDLAEDAAETIASLPIALVNKSETETAGTFKREVKVQYLHSAIAFAAAGKVLEGPFAYTSTTSPSTSTSTSTSAYTYTFRNLFISFGRVLVQQTGTMELTLDESDSGILAARITHPETPDDDPEIEDVELAEAPLNGSSNLDYTLIPLYLVEDGKITADLRQIPTATVREW